MGGAANKDCTGVDCAVRGVCWVSLEVNVNRGCDRVDCPANGICVSVALAANGFLREEPCGIGKCVDEGVG